MAFRRRVPWQSLPHAGIAEWTKEREWCGRPIRDIAGVRGGFSGRPLAYGKEP